MNRRLMSPGAVRRLAVFALVALVGCGVAVASASAKAKPDKAHKAKPHKAHKAKHHVRKFRAVKTRGIYAHGQLLRLAPHLLANTNSSSNWFGYNQGTLEQGSKLFNSITGDWVVPRATQHTAGQAEDSSDWIGIGGGCIDSGCTLTDSTLIQTGTEQDVSAGGSASYSAWWELVPAPSFTISGMTVAPGDHMHASIAEVVPDTDLWTITIRDVTRGESYSTTVPYPSTHASAEWIEETPLEIGTNAGFAALPNLTNPDFDLGTVNGAAANLKSSEELDLINSSGAVIGSPSAPDSDSDGFGACAWATSCSPPGS